MSFIQSFFRFIRSHPRMAAAFFLTFSFLGIFLLSVIGLFYIDMKLKTPRSGQCDTVEFVIGEGEGLQLVAKELEDQLLITDEGPFMFYVIAKGASKRLQAGTYRLHPCMSPREIADTIIGGKVIGDAKITIPEGFTLRQIEEELRKENLGDQLSHIPLAEYQDRYGFLRDAPSGASLEGYLFPDTYFLKHDSSEREVVEKMLDNLAGKLGSGLGDEIQNQGKTVFEVVTMASLIEREVRTPVDRRLVSGILWKRLRNDMPLQVDATILYIKSQQGVPSAESGKVPSKVNGKQIAVEDLKIDSPYNTYRFKGLPAGPISNPGLESVQAAVSPIESDFWYYLSKPDGETIFSKTLEEHNRAKQRYLGE